MNNKVACQSDYNKGTHLCGFVWFERRENEVNKRNRVMACVSWKLDGGSSRHRPAGPPPLVERLKVATEWPSLDESSLSNRLRKERHTCGLEELLARPLASSSSPDNNPLAFASPLAGGSWMAGGGIGSKRSQLCLIKMTITISNWTGSLLLVSLFQLLVMIGACYCATTTATSARQYTIVAKKGEGDRIGRELDGRFLYYR